MSSHTAGDSGPEHRSDTTGSDIRGTENTADGGRLNTLHTLVTVITTSHLLNERGVSSCGGEGKEQIRGERANQTDH